MAQERADAGINLLSRPIPADAAASRSNRVIVKVERARRADRSSMSVDAGTAVSVCAWAAATTALGVAVAAYARNCPYQDEWSLVPQATWKPLRLAWLWYEHGEHRMPLVRLALVELYRAVADFRAGPWLNMGVLAIAALRARRRWGGVAPVLLLLSMAHWDNIVSGWQLQFSLSVALALEAAAGARWPLYLLPLCGANGVLLCIPLALHCRAWPALLLCAVCWPHAAPPCGGMEEHGVATRFLGLLGLGFGAPRLLPASAAAGALCAAAAWRTPLGRAALLLLAAIALSRPLPASDLTTRYSLLAALLPMAVYAAGTPRIRGAVCVAALVGWAASIGPGLRTAERIADKQTALIEDASRGIAADRLAAMHAALLYRPDKADLFAAWVSDLRRAGRFP